MTRLGSEKRPVIVRVETRERAHAITVACTMRGWQCIAAVEPDQPADVSDFERLMNPVTPSRSARVGRNEIVTTAYSVRFTRPDFSRWTRSRNLSRT